jgi:hypothetical protein
VASELPQRAVLEPLKFKLSVLDTAPSFLITHAWATWKNSSRRVARSIVIQEETVTSDIVAQPHTSQWMVTDIVGDVPLANYDVTSLVLQDDGFALKIIFYSVGNLEAVDQPSVFTFYIDGDCNTETGNRKDYLGVEYRVRYDQQNDRAVIRKWDEQGKKWGAVIRLNSQLNGNSLALWIPYDLMGDNRQFCWQAQANNQKLRAEKVPGKNDLRFAQYGTGTIGDDTEVGGLELSDGVFIKGGDVWQYLPGWSEPPVDWNMIDFDDSDWFSGPTGIGYGQGKYVTDLSQVTHPVESDDLSLMVQQTITQSGIVFSVLPAGDFGSVFMRRIFTVPDPDSLTQLILDVDTKGGFVAYLNGVEVARRGLGAPGEPVTYDMLSAGDEAADSKPIDISLYLANLVRGSNVLAVQAHRALDSFDLTVNPELTWNDYPWNATTQVNTTPLNDSDSSASALTVPSSLSELSGKLAIPIDNGQAAYDVHIFSMPSGQELVKIPNARQPNFRFDGQRLLVNREGDGIENVYEYNLTDGTEKQISDAPQDWHPFYDQWGNRVVYGNAELAVGSSVPDDVDGELVRDEWGGIIRPGSRKPFIFVQCSLLPPHQEVEGRCRHISSLGVLVPAGQIGEIQGTHPVWTSNDMIAYKGCNSWAGFSLCGIYTVSSSSTKGFSDGFIPRQLTQESSDTPSDTKGNLIAFTSQRDGDFEAYIMDLNGQGVRNLSNRSASNDGLPTISPDGNWVAFVSDRDDQWAVWVVPFTGGTPQKLFNLPASNPWGTGNRSWTTERISWGP